MAPSVKGGSASGSAASAEVGVDAGDGDGSGVEDGQELPAVLPTLPSASDVKPPKQEILYLLSIVSLYTEGR